LLCRAPRGKIAPVPLEARSARLDAEIEEIVQILRRYGVMPVQRVATLAGADYWHADSHFGRALERAVTLKRIRRLGIDLYELTEDAPA
jgi:hypothetical protein